MSNKSILFRPSQYFNPTDISEAVTLLSKFGESARPIAGGTDLILEQDPRVKVLVDLSSLGLSYIKNKSEGVVIGASTLFSEIESSPILEKIPYRSLSYAASLVGTPQIRNMGTIGGNICRPSPCADTAPVLLALNATLKIIGPGGKRELNVSNFFKDMNKDALVPGELVMEIYLPAFPQRTGSSFIKMGRVVVGDLSLVSVAICLVMSEEDTCAEVRIALGSVAPIPIRVKGAESILVGKKPEETLLEQVSLAAAEEIQPISDVRASAEYRRNLSRVLVKRALENALAQIVKHT